MNATIRDETTTTACRGRMRRAFTSILRAAGGRALACAACLCAACSLGLAQAQVTSGDVPLGLKPVPVPEDNPQTPAKVALGRQLYFDGRLSADDSVSCASCHEPQKGWSNAAPVATGVGGKKGGRNAPTIINSAYNRFQFWDGRAGSLEEQALGPIQNPVEMAMTLPKLEKKLQAISGYRKQFQDVFGTDVTAENVAKAIAAFERTVLSGGAPYDRFQAGEKDALSEAAERGRVLFFNKARCSACHPGPNFTDNGFHNIGVGMDKKEPDQGRAAISRLGGDTGAFKTPTLREIAKTAPYMHDGSMQTLEEVIEHYDRGGIANPYLDEEIAPLKLTEQERKDLITFLKEGLSSPNYPTAKPPEMPE